RCSRLGFAFFFQAEDGIRDFHVTGVQTCALPIFSQATPSRCCFSAIINNKTFQFMKKTLHVLVMVGKYYLYGFVFQLLFLNLMYASPTKGQSSLDIKERSEEHTSELQSRENLVCRLLLEKKK